MKFTDYYCKNETLEMKYDNSLKHKAKNIYFHLYIYKLIFLFIYFCKYNKLTPMMVEKLIADVCGAQSKQDCMKWVIHFSVDSFIRE